MLKRTPASFPYRRLLPGLAVAVAACSPAFNWREVPLDDSLTVLLPCKPDRATRPLDVGGGGAWPMEMAGCKVGSATFAAARLPGGRAEEAAARATAWRAAAHRQWPDAQWVEASVAVPGAATAPPPVEARIQPGAAAAQPAAQMRWFARADARGEVTLYQLVVLGTPEAADAAATFFEGARLR